MIRSLLALACACLVCPLAGAGGFHLVALGVGGGLSTDNLTSYALRAEGESRYLVLDAGSTLPGIDRALGQGSFGPIDAAVLRGDTPQGHVFKHLLDSYFISHGHLDHFAGLVIGSPDDTKKTVYGLPATLEMLSKYAFNWSTWPNLTDAGVAPKVGTYHLQPEPAGESFALGATGMAGRIFPLSHGGTPSSMLLVTYQQQSFAYFGDTGPDAVEQSSFMAAAWRALAGEVRAGRLRGLVIETSYPNEVPDKRLYGHLTPAWLLKELRTLEQYSGGVGALRGLPVVVSHIKPVFKSNYDVRAVIRQQLADGNDVGVRFLLMEQGERAGF
ncbi:3',5'-cyclic-nucleotide phosphodiesterase [Pseudoduganella lurida]|uniref:3',5'-cyclic-nucleotide phosphodiesterase n=1 Tax=Pseudoduganella lurida TaxID=1036180 RepID=A0A562R2E2_9BURK|nr:3',5'-cyclic-nucleotide phosphodiesterase [Pseudoduganella lurida]TWI62630.1 3',5'-cyclic-nucleotide phosphodiesterase [Pseudoduganella lurida]